MPGTVEIPTLEELNVNEVSTLMEKKMRCSLCWNWESAHNRVFSFISRQI